MAQTAGIECECRTLRESLVYNDKQQSTTAPEPVPSARSLRTIRVPTDQQLRLQLEQSDLESAAVQVATSYFDEPDDQWCVRRGWVQTDAEGRQHVTVSSAPPVVILQYVHGRYRSLAGWHQQQKRYNR